MKYDFFQIILQTFHCFISHVTTSKTEMNFPLVSSEIISVTVTLDMLENAEII